MTQGYDNVPQMFAKYLDEIGRTDDVVLNTGVSNATIATTLAQIDTRLEQHNPDVVMIMLGTNDTSVRGENTVAANGNASTNGITVEQFKDRYKELVRKIPMAEKLLEIKGVGIRTVSGFLAEVGDISRFNNPKELQKLAGLALVENSSGKHKGETTISRRGRKRLRYLLFEVAMSLVAKNPEFRELHNYYTTRRLNPLKKMQSLMAIAAKLIRVFFAMLTKGVDYDPKKMVSDIKRPAVYLQAV